MTQVIDKVYSRRTNTQLVTTGTAYLLKVPMPAFGFVTKVLVQKVGGGSFTVDVLNSALGLTPGNINPASLPASWPVYKVMPQAAGASGVAAAFAPAGWAYRNADGPDPVRTGTTASGGGSYTDASRNIYVLIQGAADTYEVALTVSTGVGG